MCDAIVKPAIVQKSPKVLSDLASIALDQIEDFSDSGLRFFRFLLVAAGVLDDFAVIGQAALRHQVHIATQFGDVTHGL